MASSVAAVAAAKPADEECDQAGESVAAVAPFHKKKQQYQQAGRRGNGAKGGNAATPAAVTGNAERKASGLCRFHWKYGEEARICTKPCSWQGN
jgi:phage gp16-like protein